MASEKKNGNGIDEPAEPLRQDLRSYLGKGKDDGKANRKVCETFANEAPLVASLLGGLPAEGKDPAIEGGKISFWIQEGKMRFCATVKTVRKNFIGDITNPANPWQSVNWALMTGNVSEREYTERPNSLPEHSKDDLVF